MWSLEERRSELEEWDGRLVLIVPEARTGEADDAAESPSRFPVLVDAAERLAGALSVRPPATVVADQWGEIHSVEETGREHRFPPPNDLVEWVRYRAVQCPECPGETP